MEGLIFLGAFFVLIAYLFYCSFKKDMNNPVLKNLRDTFRSNKSFSLKMEPRIFYFWDSNSKKEYINGAMLTTDDDGVYVKGNMLDSWWFKETFIPWSELDNSGTMRWLLYLKLNVYYLKSLDCYVAFPSKLCRK